MAFNLTLKQDRVVNSSGLKWSVFIVQKLALHKNGVEFRQQLNSTLRFGLWGQGKLIKIKILDLCPDLI